MNRRTISAYTALAAVVSIAGTAAALASGNGGFRTDPAGDADGRQGRVWSSTPLLTVGDRLSRGYRFEAIPDGISVRSSASGQESSCYVNHETSKVPFPYNAAGPDRGQRRERLRQRAGQPAGPQPAFGRRS